MRAVSLDEPIAVEVPVVRRRAARHGRRVGPGSAPADSLGLVLTITLVAFESLAISTVMPVVADDLGGLGLYGWVFSGFFLGNLFGIVTAGQAADARGTAFPFAVGLGLFSVGLLVGGLAPSMSVLVAGRVAQGIGAGAIPAVAYTTVSRMYPADAPPARVRGVLDGVGGPRSHRAGGQRRHRRARSAGARCSSRCCRSSRSPR